jgi:membrane-associated HD superfamily phosphohydrolase
MNATDSSIEISLKHIKTALILLPVFFIVMFLDSKNFNEYFFMNVKIISLTHIFTLGFLLMIIMGASYMLLPVALGVKIAYEKLFFPVYYAYTASLLLFIIGMHYFIGSVIAVGGVLLFISILIYNVNILASLKKVKKWDYSAAGIAFAYSYLFIGLSVGLYLALSFYFKIGLNIYDILQDHIYVMFIGFAAMLFIAISYRLLPMFYMTKTPVNL